MNVLSLLVLPSNDAQTKGKASYNRVIIGKLDHMQHERARDQAQPLREGPASTRYSSGSTSPTFR
jgi:hypothetical protein